MLSPFIASRSRLLVERRELTVLVQGGEGPYQGVYFSSFSFSRSLSLVHFLFPSLPCSPSRLLLFVSGTSLLLPVLSRLFAVTFFSSLTWFSFSKVGHSLYWFLFHFLARWSAAFFRRGVYRLGELSEGTVTTVLPPSSFSLCYL